MNKASVNNPFNITKAVDYTDAEINQSWVDFPSKGFTDIVKPTMSMPMLILGGKGSGKTHLMRYFSYNLQSIRYGSNLEKKLKRDAYVGIYMRCGGLNAKRFSGKGLDEEKWLQIFSYYMDLWIAQLTLDTLTKVLTGLVGNHILSEENFVGQILNLFDKSIILSKYSIVDLKLYLSKKQKEIDYEINQLSLSKRDISESIEILSSPGRLIFGIPKIIETCIPYFSKFQFLYLIDEYENLEKYHQRYFNTLIREREAPSTFRVGVRLYGIKTYETYSGGESIKEGSEYESFDIDGFLRSDDSTYTDYVRKICQRRLELNGFPLLNNDLDDYFEKFSYTDLQNILLNKPSIGHFDKLRSKLKKSVQNIELIENIIDNLSFKEDILIERTNVLLFYRGCKSIQNKDQLLVSSQKIGFEATFYFRNRHIKTTAHYRVLDKFKNDLVDQLCRENQIDLPYYGLDNFINMSSGIPRVLLKTLKEVYKQSYFNGEKPFMEGLISKKSQLRGLRVSTEWFIEDAAPTDDKSVKSSLKKLGDFLRELRFSDLPPESSICIFSINNAHLSEGANKTISLLKSYSYIVEADNRREKEGNTVNQTYRLNGIIAHNWGLALHRRGVITLNRAEVESIFSSNSGEFFEEVLEARKKRYNPSILNKNANLSLFEDDHD